MSKEDEIMSIAQTKSLTVLQNRGYKLLSPIGKGAYAKVYLGEFKPVSSNNIAATVKTPLLLASKIIDTKKHPRKYVKQFLPREILILQQLNHPYIIHIHSILQIRQKYYIFMQYAENHDLHNYIVKNGRINENQARVWTHQISLALQYLHELNIAHRDMKCENVLVTQNYNVKLADFGFARYTVDANCIPIKSETYCGSLSYVSPEILRGKPYDPKLSDLWSFGVLIYVMLNKSVPFHDRDIHELYRCQMTRQFKFGPKIERFLSSEVKILVHHLLDPVPTMRYSSDNIVNSNWIAMDKRLSAQIPLEIAARAIHQNNTLPVSDSSIMSEVSSKEEDSGDNWNSVEEKFSSINVIKKVERQINFEPIENSRVIKTKFVLHYKPDDEYTENISGNS